MRSARSIVPVLPTAITLGNLVFGFLAMAKTVDALNVSAKLGPLDPAFSERILHACYFVLAAMVCDALDGRVARLTKQTSPFGSMLDSLADVVTFGVTPALMAKVVYEHTKVGLDQTFSAHITTSLCVLYLIGAGLRLARFTATTDADEASHHTFVGLPSPAAAAMIVTTCMFCFEGRSAIGLAPETADAMAIGILRALPLLAACLGLLMVSRLSYVHVVQRYVGHRTRVATFVTIVLVVWLTVSFMAWSLFAMTLLYVGGGLVLAARARITGRPVHESLPPPVDVEEPVHWDDPPAAGPGNGGGSRHEIRR